MSDLISREAAIEAITNYAKFLRDNFHEPCNLAGMIDAIEAQPTIDPVKHGRWVKQTDENCWWYECSECGDYPPKNAYGHEVLSKYCPNCGARMEPDQKVD